MSSYGTSSDEEVDEGNIDLLDDFLSRLTLAPSNEEKADLLNSIMPVVSKVMRQEQWKVSREHTLRSRSPKVKGHFITGQGGELRPELPVRHLQREQRGRDGDGRHHPPEDRHLHLARDLHQKVKENN